MVRMKSHMTLTCLNLDMFYELNETAIRGHYVKLLIQLCQLQYIRMIILVQATLFYTNVK